METFVHNIGQVLGTTILNSLWQGLLIFAVVRLGVIAFPAASAAKKYNALYIALTAMAIWFGYTFFVEAKALNWSAEPTQPFSFNVNDSVLQTVSPPDPNLVEEPFYYRYKTLVQAFLPYLSAIYLLSVLINISRLAMGWHTIRKLKKHAIVAEQWQALTIKLANRTGITKKVRIYFSNLADVPCALGYLKPVLLLPFTIGTQLTAEEIEVIILHELAHIKNNDYILNLIQQIMTLLLFLNPFARLISNMIDLERENRCDDTVVQTGNPLTYAGALVKLEKTRQQNLQLALAATGKKYHLFYRVKRIMSDDKPVVNIKHLVFGLLIFISALGCIAWLNPEIENGKLVSENGAAAVSKIAELVKETIIPDEPDPVPSQNVPALVAASTVSDSSANVLGADTTDSKKAKRKALLSEYEKVYNEWLSGKKKLEQSPEGKALTEARRVLDSLRQRKIKSQVTPEIEKESMDVALADSKRFFGVSEEDFKERNQLRKLRVALSEIASKQPEMIAYMQEHERLKEVVKKAIMKNDGLSEDQLRDNTEFRDWTIKELSREDSVKRKLQYVPEIKALQYTIDSIVNQTKLRREAMPRVKHSPANIAAYTATGFDKYEAAVKEAKEKLFKTDLYIKNQRDRKRLDELERALSQ